MGLFTNVVIGENILKINVLPKLLLFQNFTSATSKQFIFSAEATLHQVFVEQLISQALPITVLPAVWQRRNAQTHYGANCITLFTSLLI